MSAPSAGSSSNAGEAGSEPSKQFTCPSAASSLDIRLLEIYRSLFTTCYTSKRMVEAIAVSSQTQTSTPNGTDYASSEYEVGASSSTIQLSDHSLDSTAFVVSTHPGLGSCASSDSTAFPRRSPLILLPLLRSWRISRFRVILHSYFLRLMWLPSTLQSWFLRCPPFPSSPWPMQACLTLPR